MSVFINGFTYLSEVFIIYTYAAGMLEKKYNTIKTLLVGLGIFTIPFILNQLWNNSIVNIISFFIATTVYLYLTHQIKIKHGVLQGLILTAIMFVTEMICSYSLSLMFGQTSFYAYRDSTQVFILCSIISKIFFLVACKICNHFILRKNKLYTTPASYFLFSFTSIFSMFVFILINSQYNFNNAMQILVIISSLLLMVSLVLLFISHERNAVKNAELMELRSEQQRKTTDEKYLKVIEAQNDEIHRLVHDVKHHLNTIHNLSKSVEVDSYIASVENELQKSTAFSKTGNKILDIILNEYFILCHAKNIEFETEIRTANLDFIEPAKLTALLNNILDNAVEATEKCKTPRIFLSINRSDNFNVLCCTNTCLSSPVFVNENLITTKKDKSLHGYGTKSIIKILKEYNATHTFTFNEIKNEFTITAIFPIN